MRKYLSAMLILLVLIASTQLAYADTDADSEPLVKEYTFTSNDLNFAYEAEPEIKQDGKTYTLKGIKSYELVDMNKYFMHEAVYTGLSEKKVPEKRVFQLDGKDVELTLLEGSEVYSAMDGSVTETTKGYPAKTTKITKNDQQYTARLVNAKPIKSEATANEPFTVKGKFIGEPGVLYDFNGKQLKLDESSPVWQGHDAELLEYLGLPSDYKITESKWTSDYIQEDGETVRYAEYSGIKPGKSEKVTGYTATYEYAVYSATATYTNGVEPGTEEYTVKAYVEYDEVIKESNLLQLILKIAAGLAVLALLVSAILFVISKRRKEKEGENQHGY